MLDKVDEMIIGGGMAFTFRKELDNMPVRSQSSFKKCHNDSVRVCLFWNAFLCYFLPFLLCQKAGRVNFWKGTREMTIFHLLYSLDTMFPLLLIVATLVKPLSVGEVVSCDSLKTNNERGGAHRGLALNREGPRPSTVGVCIFAKKF
jgi:hypothetical protein